MHKVKLEILYTPSGIAGKVSELMSQCDLGIDGIGLTMPIEFTTKTNPTKEYITKLKKALTGKFKDMGCKNIEINILEKYKIIN